MSKINIRRAIKLSPSLSSAIPLFINDKRKSIQYLVTSHSEPYTNNATKDTEKSAMVNLSRFKRKIRISRGPVTKTTKSFEIRRKANEAKARELALKAAKKEMSNSLTRNAAINSAKSGGDSIAAHSQLSKRSLKPRMTPAILNLSPKKSYFSPHRRAAGGGLSARSKEAIQIDKVTTRTRTVEVQTCKSEIVNSMLIIGDAKVIRPSPAVWGAILRKREEDLKRAMLKEERQVPEYSKAEVNYQTNLKEFLETGAVKHYDRGSDGMETDKTEKSSKPQNYLARKQTPPPEMDLRKRLPKIEKELLDVFNRRT